MKGPRPLACHATPALGGPARQGEGAAVSIYLTGPHSPSRAMYRGQGRLWGKSTTPSSPWNSWGSQGLWREQHGGEGWLLPGEGSSAVFPRRRLRSAWRGSHGPGSGKQGDLAQPFHTILPQVTLTALSPATGPVPSPPPPEEAWGPQPSLCRWPGPAPRPRAHACVCVCACVCHCASVTVS